MPTSGLIQWGGLAGMGGGVLFIVYSLLGAVTGKGDEPGPLDLLVILAYVLIVVGLAGFHALQQRNYGRIGRAGLYTTIGAIVLWEIFLVASLLGGEGSFDWFAAVGVLGLLVGEVLYGAATLQARVLPRWCGVLFILLMPVTIFFGVILPGALAILWVGLAWLALGYGLWSHRSGAAAEQQPLRVR